MKIIIEYNGSWENSFLDGTIESNFNKERSYIGSSDSGFDSYKHIQLSKDTIIGILNRLVGEQRRLFQARLDPEYYFKDLESVISFKDNSIVSNETIFLRNINGSSDKTSLKGVRKAELNELFSEKYKDRFWGILKYAVDELENFLLKDEEQKYEIEKFDRFDIADLLNLIEKNKSVGGSGIKYLGNPSINEVLLKMGFLDEEALAKGVVYKTLVYCSLYKMANKLLKENPEFKKNLTPSGGLQGISKRSFTFKDFFKGIGTNKTVSGNPSKYEGYIQIEGREKKTLVEYFLKKKWGTIEIDIPVNTEKALEIKELIQNAGVNSFTVGKKGLAFVQSILI